MAMGAELSKKYLTFHDALRPMAAMDASWPAGTSTGWHSHPRGQLLFAIEGVMMINVAHGSWVIPPNRALWIKAGESHDVKMSGNVQMRTVFIDTARVDALPAKTSVLNVSPLLRELIVAATGVPLDYAADSRDERLMQLLIDELRGADVLPLFLPMPTDPRISAICSALINDPADTSTAAQWAEQLAISAKTIHRMFFKETGMSFAKWREQARLFIAIRRISAGDKVIDVALDCGYASPSAFTAMFKRHFGMPPSAYYS
jgi:AraC-like DNA-binding protein/mannose-6-phosphate isomerase-like protein (cupin superfamily)